MYYFGHVSAPFKPQNGKGKQSPTKVGVLYTIWIVSVLFMMGGVEGMPKADLVVSILMLPVEIFYRVRPISK